MFLKKINSCRKLNKKHKQTDKANAKKVLPKQTKKKPSKTKKELFPETKRKL